MPLPACASTHRRQRWPVVCCVPNEVSQWPSSEWAHQSWQPAADYSKVVSAIVPIACLLPGRCSHPAQPFTSQVMSPEGERVQLCAIPRSAASLSSSLTFVYGEVICTELVRIKFNIKLPPFQLKAINLNQFVNLYYYHSDAHRRRLFSRSFPKSRHI